MTENVDIWIIPRGEPNETVSELGHMWMSWWDSSAKHREHRGYYYALEKLPPEIRKAGTQAINNFLFSNATPGVYRRDLYAKNMEQLYHSFCKTHRLFFCDSKFRTLVASCDIPRGQNEKEEGLYSFATNDCTESLEWNNCVSWVGKRINNICEQTSIQIPSPARIKTMHNEWSDRITNECIEKNDGTPC